MRRRGFLEGMGWGAAAWALGHAARRCDAGATKPRRGGPSASRPNILWIVSEDTGPEFGCYGYPLVDTPHVDRLAAEGARFTAAFTVTPVCSTSRSSFMTGTYCTTIGAHHHRSHRGEKFPLPDGVRVFTHYLREAGYFAALCGKRKTDWNFRPTAKPYDSHDWGELKAHQPFFAQVQFSETHRGFKHCKEHPVDPETVELPPYYPDHPVARRDWALYLETVNVLDQKIGRVLRRLEADGLAENTVVFYFGDHGRAHVRGKQWLYDGGIHVPLVIRWPGRIQPGTVREEPVSAVDFAPTCLRLAGVDVPEHMPGRVFLGPDRDEPREVVFASRDRCDETIDCIRCARTRRYKYIRNLMPDRPYTQPNRYKDRSYPMLRLLRRLHAEGKLTPAQEAFMASSRPPEELYDIQADPWEVHNLAASPQHRQALERLREAATQWMDRVGDLGEIPEPQLQALYKAHDDPRAILREETNRQMVQRIRQVRRAADQGEEGVPELVAALEDPAPAVRYVAARRLGSLGAAARPAVERLATMLKDLDGGVRAAAARALCLLGRTDEALPVLVKELRENRERVVRHVAACALEDIGEGARPALDALRAARKDKYGYVQRVATRVVAHLEG